ncbi:MAG: hypothetical protein KA174_00220 [Chitinophagales bacterium]|nr:hypothetical protein [Chitinophagales bacterium]
MKEFESYYNYGKDKMLIIISPFFICTVIALLIEKYSISFMFFFPLVASIIIFILYYCFDFFYYKLIIKEFEMDIYKRNFLNKIEIKTYEIQQIKYSYKYEYFRKMEGFYVLRIFFKSKNIALLIADNVQWRKTDLDEIDSSFSNRQIFKFSN